MRDEGGRTFGELSRVRFAKLDYADFSDGSFQLVHRLAFCASIVEGKPLSQVRSRFNVLML
jgi:hypothetical protein